MVRVLVLVPPLQDCVQAVGVVHELYTQLVAASVHVLVVAFHAQDVSVLHASADDA
jgi:hypothetical protein